MCTIGIFSKNTKGMGWKFRQQLTSQRDATAWDGVVASISIVDYSLIKRLELKELLNAKRSIKPRTLPLAIHLWYVYPSNTIKGASYICCIHSKRPTRIEKGARKITSVTFKYLPCPLVSSCLVQFFDISEHVNHHGICAPHYLSNVGWTL